MNLKKGLFRIWLVLSIGWVLFVFAAYMLSESLRGGELTLGRFNVNFRIAFGLYLFGYKWLYILAISFLPPIIVFVFGNSIIWALQGFKK